MAYIIVVDDDPDTAQLLTDLLTEAGHQVGTAGNGLEAIKLLMAGHPQLLLVDIMMPVMHGLTLCHYLKGDPELAPIPLVMMSTRANKPLIDACDHQGFLDKPFAIETVFTLVDALLGDGATQTSAG